MSRLEPQAVVLRRNLSDALIGALSLDLRSQIRVIQLHPSRFQMPFSCWRARMVSCRLALISNTIVLNVYPDMLKKRAVSRYLK